MNEQLIVKNFGPIKDATVDFKRVTVFIGPTGGGKSTLAKLAAICKDSYFTSEGATVLDALKAYSLENYVDKSSHFSWVGIDDMLTFDGDLKLNSKTRRTKAFTRFVNSLKSNSISSDFASKLRDYSELRKKSNDPVSQEEASVLAKEVVEILLTKTSASKPQYIPSDRAFVTSIASSFAGLMRDDIGIAKALLNFTNTFFQIREDVHSLDIHFLDVEYFRHDNKDYIGFNSITKPDSLQLSETASGIQSVTPMLVVLEYLSRNNEQSQSFLVEEPELNLYPTAQQGLLNWLVEKCTKGENDLTLTTHSPYILSHLNLLLYAHYVGSKDEEKRRKVAAVVPEEYWINPDEFSAYYVGDGGVRSLVDADTKLIAQNALDTISGVQADQFDQLLDINQGF